MSPHAILPIAVLTLVSVAGPARAQHAGMHGEGAGAYDRAQAAFMSHNLPGAEAAYRMVVAGDTVEAHKSEAATTLAAIAWRVRRDTAAAAQVLAEAAGTTWGPYAAALARSRMLRSVGDYAGARASAARAIDAARTPVERAEATLAWAQSVIQPALAERLAAGGGQSAPTDPALLRDAVARLDSLVHLAPGLLDPARQLVIGAALLDDRAALADGWRSYYLVGSSDTLRGPLASAREAIRSGKGPLARALAESRFFDAAAAVVMAPSAPAFDPESREIVAYARFADTVSQLTDEYYRKTALGQGDTTAWHAGLDSAARALWPELRWNGAAPEFNEQQLAEEIDRRFGALVNFGETAGYQDLHMGHRVVDEKRTVRQYGRSASVRFVALDGLVSNGFQSWAWDGRAQHGGWANKTMIVQIRPGYAEGPLYAWLDLTDSARIRRRAERIAADSVADFDLGRRKAVTFFPSVAERLERDGRLQLLDSLKRAGFVGRELEAQFERAIGDAVVEYSIFAHEGRHAIDAGISDKLKAPELEYRAKLSQVAFAPIPRLAFDGIMSPNLGDQTPHGLANRWMMEGIERWMRTHASGLPVDVSLPLLPQLPRLNDPSLRAAAASLDPLAPHKKRKPAA